METWWLLQLAGKIKRRVNNTPCREAAYLNQPVEQTACRSRFFV